MTDNPQTPAPAHDPKKDKLVAGCVIGGLSLLGIAFLAVGIYRMTPSWETIQNARASTSWTETEAKITGARINVIEGSTSTGTPNRYQPTAGYTYQVDGTEYTGENIRFAELDYHNRGARNKAQKVIDPYSNYPTVKAYYNPADPSVSVLEPGVTLATFGAITDSILWLLFGIVILGFAIYLLWPQKKQAAEKR
ncbi:MAG: hypothetical protein CMO55_12775 [Verrucomicrobiales bacterium]|nr:hypothetical protein [Verrucomicrobiales bacterium]